MCVTFATSVDLKPSALIRIEHWILPNPKFVASIHTIIYSRWEKKINPICQIQFYFLATIFQVWYGDTVECLRKKKETLKKIRLGKELIWCQRSATPRKWYVTPPASLSATCRTNKNSFCEKFLRCIIPVWKIDCAPTLTCRLMPSNRGTWVIWDMLLRVCVPLKSSKLKRNWKSVCLPR